MRAKIYLAGLKEHGLIKFVVLVLLVGNLIEGLLLFKFARQERVFFVPPLEKQAWISEDAASPEYLEETARYLLPLITNFHPSNLKTQIPLFLRYVAPEQWGEVKSKLMAQAEEVKKNDLAQTFYIQRMEVRENIVQATGIVRRFIGKVQTSEEVISYEIRFELRNRHPFVYSVGILAGVGAPDHQ